MKFPQEIHPSATTEISPYFSYYPKILDEETIFSYKGPFTPTIIAEIKEIIESKFASQNHLAYKLVNISVELAQNILFYSEEFNYYAKRNKVGNIILTQNPHSYTIASGNLMLKKNQMVLEERIKQINALNTEELRGFKRELRNIASFNQENNQAGIGLIQVALLAENPLQWVIQPVDEDYVFLILYARIKK